MITPEALAKKMADKSDQELLAVWACPDDWTAQALAAAKAELQKRGLHRHLEQPTTAPGYVEEGDADNSVDVYEFFGNYPNPDARVLLDAFVGEGIRYTLNLDKMELENISGFQAANGGTFGAGVGMAIGVHVDDCQRAMETRLRVFKIVV